jgi:hypothetical protein
VQALVNAAGLWVRVMIIISLFQRAQFESPATTFHCFPTTTALSNICLCALSALIWWERRVNLPCGREVKVLQRRSVFHTTMTSAHRCLLHNRHASLYRVSALSNNTLMHTQISVFVSGARVLETALLLWLLWFGASGLYTAVEILRPDRTGLIICLLICFLDLFIL